MNEKSGNFELLEPCSPEALVPEPWLEPWMIAAAVVLALGVLAVLVFKKKTIAPLDPRAIRQAAHAEAAAALEQIGAVSARDAAVRSSRILREYLSAAVGDPALFETHEETISRHKALEAFSEEARAAVCVGFTRLAGVKYADEIPADVAAGEVIAESIALLETLHHGFRA